METGRRTALRNNWYVAGLILMVLAFIDTAVLDYTDHQFYGILVSTWGLACFVMGLRSEVKR